MNLHRPLGSGLRALTAGLGLVGAFGCGAGAVSTRPATAVAAAAAASCDPARDRSAILAMAGGYTVDFEFRETVALAAGYTLRPPYEVGATERVIVVEDSPERVSLQHILAMGKGDERKALKHWRQDWTFEPERVLAYELEYQGGENGESWAMKPVPAGERRCVWAQEVFGIEDGPRYGSWGRWVHSGGVSTWTSGETWRPLPRRESKRDDYDVIVGINRHTITAAGWSHEQDNGKLVLRGKNQLLVREQGVIPYNRTSSEDFSVIDTSWTATAGFWADVRAGWRAVMSQRDRLTFLPSAKVPRSLDDDFEALREKGTTGEESGSLARREVITATILRHLTPDDRLARK